MQEKMILLADAFRAVLPSIYRQRPGLADEIQSKDYFRSPFDESTGWRLDPEVQAADFALAVLKDAIVSQSVRLHGRLGDNLPDDIDPTEVVRTGILVFDNALEVWEPSTSSSPFRMLRTYRNVHCYAAEVATLVSETEHDALDNGSRPGIQTTRQAKAESACSEFLKAIPKEPRRKA